MSLTNLDQTDMKLFNPSNAFDAEGMTRLTEEIETRKKKRNDIEQDTVIAIRAKNLESEKRALISRRRANMHGLEQEREIAVRRAQQRAEVALEKAEREREIEEAQIRAKEAIDRARIKHELALNAEHILARAGNRTARDSAPPRRRGRGAKPRRRGRGQRGRKSHQAGRGDRGAQDQAQRDRARGDGGHAGQDSRSRVARAHHPEGERIRRLDQEQEVEIRRARQRAEVEFEKAERGREIEENQIRAKEAVERAKIKLDLAVESERILRDQEAERLEVQRRRALELEEQDRLIAVAQKAKAQSDAQTAAEAARKLMVEAQESVTTAREREIAERRKMVDLIEATQQAQRNAIKLTTMAAAEKAAAIDHAEAEKAAVEAARHRYDAEAEGNRKLNEAENMRSDATRRTALNKRLFENLPAIIRESVRPMERIESIKILQVDGLPGFSNGQSSNGPGGGSPGGDGKPGNLAESVVDAAMRYRAQIPFVDNLLKEVGMTPNNLSDLTNLGVRLPDSKPPKGDGKH